VAGNGQEALIHAVRWAVLGRYLGQLALVQAVLALPALAVSLFYGEDAASLRFLGVIALLIASGWPLSRLEAPDRIQPNEAMVIVTLAFVLNPLLMSWPLAAYGLPAVDALFEAVSGVTTTGLTTLVHVEGLPHGFLFARTWMQWYGGLGFAVLAVALLAHHAQALRRLVEPGASGLLASSVRMYARRVLTVYALLTLAGILLIHSAGLAPFDALAHGLAAISSGGFSTFDRSLGDPLPASVAAAVMFVALCGAIALPLYHNALRHGPRALFMDVEVRALFSALLLLTGVLFAWFWHTGMAPWDALRHALSTAVAAQTTAGFSTLEVANLDVFPMGLMILAMAVGGSVGSTAGGIKLLRVLILLRLIQSWLRRAAAPEHAVVLARLGGRRLEDEEIQRALLVILLFVLLVLLSWLVFLAYGYAPLPALFEVVSAAGTVGLSTGISADGLPTLLKLVLCLDMLAGRLEIVALLVTVYPATWIGRQREA